MQDKGSQVPYSCAFLGLKATLAPGPLKQISLPHQASRSRFLLLAPRSAAVAS